VPFSDRDFIDGQYPQPGVIGLTKILFQIVFVDGCSGSGFFIGIRLSAPPGDNPGQQIVPSVHNRIYAESLDHFRCHLR